jgi:hypothetical protein
MRSTLPPLGFLPRLAAVVLACLAIGAFTALSTAVVITQPVLNVGDFDGDGKSDVAVHRRGGGLWLVLQSSTDFTNVVTYGLGEAGISPSRATMMGTGRLIPPSFPRPMAFTRSGCRARTSQSSSLFSGVSATGVSTPISQSRAITTGTGRPISPSIALARALTTSCCRVPTSQATERTYWGNSTDVPVLGPIRLPDPCCPWDY